MTKVRSRTLDELNREDKKSHQRKTSTIYIIRLLVDRDLLDTEVH